MKLRTLFSIHILPQNSVLTCNIECKTLPFNGKLKFATVLGKAVLTQVILRTYAWATYFRHCDARKQSQSLVFS
jgi:hypothetical protein